MCHLALNSVYFTCMPYLRSFYFYKPWRISLIIGMEDHYIFCRKKVFHRDVWKTKSVSVTIKADMLITLFLISSSSSKIYNHSLFITHMTISTLLIVAVCRTHVTHEPQLTTVFHNSVVRLSDRCTGGHRFNSCQGLRFFLCPVLVTCWSHHFSFFSKSASS